MFKTYICRGKEKEELQTNDVFQSFIFFKQKCETDHEELNNGFLKNENASITVECNFIYKNITLFGQNCMFVCLRVGVFVCLFVLLCFFLCFFLYVVHAAVAYFESICITDGV